MIDMWERGSFPIGDNSVSEPAPSYIQAKLPLTLMGGKSDLVRVSWTSSELSRS